MTTKINPDDNPLVQHCKLHDIQNQSQACGEFIEWLRQEKGIRLAQYRAHDPERHEELFAVRTPIQQLLAEFFEIDLDELEKEKQRMLDKIIEDADSAKTHDPFAK